MLFFDIDQTLLDFKGAERAAVEAVHGNLFEMSRLDFQDFYKMWCHFGEIHFKRYLNREISFEQQRLHRVKDIFNSIAIMISDQRAREVFEQYLEYFEDSWRVFDDVIPCLEGLNGRRLGIITNGDDNQQRKKLERTGIASYFEVVITSERVGKAKPDPYIFEFACREAGVRPEECIYVGDNLQVDILGSRSYNLKGIWLNREQASEEGQQHVVTITSLTELDKYL